MNFALKKKTDIGFESFTFRIGQLCLVDETKATETTQEKKLVNTKNSLPCSVLVIGQDLADPNTLKTLDKEDNSVKTDKIMFRGIVIDESPEKCVVQNLDNGKKLSVGKKLIRPLFQISLDAVGTLDESRSRLNAINLVQIIPFMLIKAKTLEEITNEGVKRLLKNSLYFSKEIFIRIGKTKKYLIF